LQSYLDHCNGELATYYYTNARIVQHYLCCDVHWFIANDQIKGTLEAPSNRSVWLDRNLQEWITFEGIDRLHVLGGGTLNGNGQQRWINSCKLNRSMVNFFFQKKEVLELTMSSHWMVFFLNFVYIFYFHPSAMRHWPDGTSLTLHFAPESSVHPR